MLSRIFQTEVDRDDSFLEDYGLMDSLILVSSEMASAALVPSCMGGVNMFEGWLSPQRRNCKDKKGKEREQDKKFRFLSGP